MNKTGIARAGMVSLFGGATGALSGLLLAVVIGRGLGPEGTGFFFQTIALFLILANVLELGADTGLVRELARQVSLRRFQDLKRTVLVAVVPVVVAGVIVLGVVWLFAPAVASVIAAPAAQATTAALITTTVPFVLLASLLAVLLGGTRGLGGVLPFVGIFNVGLPVLRVVVVLIALSLGLGLTSVTKAWAWPLVAACTAAAVILVRQLSATATASGGDEAPRTPTGLLARQFWSFSAARGVAAALEIGLQWADVLVVAAMLGPGEAGIYAVVTRCARAGLLVETAMRMAVSPRISGSLSTGDVDVVKDLHLGATRAMILLSWPLYLTLALFAPAVLAVFGDGFGGGVTALVVLCGAMMLLSAAGMVQTVLLMGGRSHWQMTNKALALMINLAGTVLLVPVWGIMGAAVAWVVTIAVDAMLATWQVHRLMAIRIAVRQLALPVLLVAGAVVMPGLGIRAIMGTTTVALAIHLVLAGALLVTLCWKFRDRLGVDTFTRRVATQSR